jgi:hypothetical protein
MPLSSSLEGRSTVLWILGFSPTDAEKPGEEIGTSILDRWHELCLIGYKRTEI